MQHIQNRKTRHLKACKKDHVNIEINLYKKHWNVTQFEEHVHMDLLMVSAE